MKDLIKIIVYFPNEYIEIVKGLIKKTGEDNRTRILVTAAHLYEILLDDYQDSLGNILIKNPKTGILDKVYILGDCKFFEGVVKVKMRLRKKSIDLVSRLIQKTGISDKSEVFAASAKVFDSLLDKYKDDSEAILIKNPKTGYIDRITFTKGNSFLDLPRFRDN